MSADSLVAAAVGNDADTSAECVAAVAPVTTPRCTICLDEDASVVQKGCFCRGDAGCVHVSCLVEVAKHSAANANNCAPWYRCDVCHGDYTGGAELAMAQARHTLAQSLPQDATERLHAITGLCNAYHSIGR